jgi:predicted amidohydrolase
MEKSMPSITIAAVQMDGAVSPKSQRLKRAAAQIAAAAKEGAKLIVLPEYFNTGMTYLETQYEATEALNDESLNWLSEQAKKHQVHVAGALLVVDKDDSYNAAFLIAPDGRQWRYDKNFPFLWERVFFREGRGITVADTELGKIGFLMGWDAAHEDLFQRYAAKVDLLLVLHSNPDFRQAKLRFPDGSSLSDFGTFPTWFAHHTGDYLEEPLLRQAQWLNVPMVIAGASGDFSSILPAPYFSMNALLATKPRWRGKAEDVYGDILLEAAFQQKTAIISAKGEVIATVETQGDTYALASLELSAKPPLPVDGMEQPLSDVPSAARVLADVLAVAGLSMTYKQGLRRQWGAVMAKTDSSTKTWLGVLAAGMILASLLTWFFTPRGRRK